MFPEPRRPARVARTGPAVIVVGASRWEEDISGVVDGAPILPVLPLVKQRVALGDTGLWPIKRFL